MKRTKPIAMGKPKRMSLKEQAEFFQFLGELLKNGFSLIHALTFTKVMLPKQKAMLEQIIASLAQGQRLSHIFTQLKFSMAITNQLTLAEQHGNVEQTLLQIGGFLKLRNERLSQLKQLLSYPVFLVAALIGLTLAMHEMLGDQFAAEQKTSTGITQWLPYLISLFVLIFGLLFYLQYRKWSVYDRAVHLTRWPIVGPVFKSYYDYRITQQFGMLLASGLNLQAVTDVLMKLPKKSLDCQIGYQLNLGLVAGKELTRLIQEIKLLPNEMILFFGKGNHTEEIGSDLITFSGYCYSEMNQRIIRVFSLIQPCLFLIIGTIIVSVYWQILAPIYQMMEGITNK